LSKEILYLQEAVVLEPPHLLEGEEVSGRNLENQIRRVMTRMKVVFGGLDEMLSELKKPHRRPMKGLFRGRKGKDTGQTKRTALRLSQKLIFL
jgi:hypothetical protein